MRDARELAHSVAECFARADHEYTIHCRVTAAVARAAQDDARKCDDAGHHRLRAVMDGRGSWCCACGTMFVMLGDRSEPATKP